MNEDAALLLEDAVQFACLAGERIGGDAAAAAGLLKRRYEQLILENDVLNEGESV